MSTTIHPAHTQVPSGPRGHLIYGNLLSVRRDPLNFYTAAHAQYGDIVRFRSIGPFYWYLVAHPDDIEHVLRSKYYPKGPFVNPIKTLVGNGLITSEGEFWLRQRRLAQPAFHRRQLAEMAVTMSATAQSQPTGGSRLLNRSSRWTWPRR